MDYSGDLYPKIPFYMTYPMQNMYLTEMEYEKDIERMKNYYPEKTKDIMKLVEERLDELAYEGSRIYDEEPDRMMIQMEIDRLYQKLLEQQGEQSQAVPSYSRWYRWHLRDNSTDHRTRIVETTGFAVW